MMCVRMCVSVTLRNVTVTSRRNVEVTSRRNVTVMSRRNVASMMRIRTPRKYFLLCYRYMLNLLNLEAHPVRLRLLRTRKVLEELEEEYSPTFTVMGTAIDGEGVWGMEILNKFIVIIIY